MKIIEVVMTTNNKKSWEKLLGETSKQFEAFCIYRDMGTERSISEVAKVWSNSGATSRLTEWSRKHQWVERAASYDQYVDELKRYEQEDQIREMASRHARDAQLFQAKVHDRLENINPDDLKPNDIIKWYEVAVKIERLSRGVPTENIKQEKIQGVEDVITKERLQDPRVRKKATEFIKTLADSQSRTDRVSIDSK